LGIRQRPGSVSERNLFLVDTEVIRADDNNFFGNRTQESDFLKKFRPNIGNNVVMRNNDYSGRKTKPRREAKKSKYSQENMFDDSLL